MGYEDVPWPQLHDKMAANFASGVHTHDVVYMSGWVPEFADFLVPFVDQLPAGLVADLPPSSFSTVTWDGQKLGAVFTLSLLTTFYNKAMFEAEGITAPPATWDELLGIAEQLTKDGKYGWVLNYGEPAGIGGVATYWFVFLQQAGGHLWDARRPARLQHPGRCRLPAVHDRPDEVHGPGGHHATWASTTPPTSSPTAAPP